MPLRNIARCLVLNENNEILLLRRGPSNKSRVGLWEIVGGKEDDADGSIIHTLKREAAEETGANFSALSDVIYEADVTSPEAANSGTRYILQVCVGRIATNEILLSDEHDAFAWTAQHDALSYQLTPETETALNTILPTLAWVDI
jgi:8-oxo-dGTP pyrophosphatase MutT (NUDIX family)